jgi:dTDP-4-amino-4,6-dideoxygalactose transaminase
LTNLQHVPLVDLQAQYQTIKQDVLTAIELVLDNMQLFLGPQQKAFEQEFAAYCGCRYAISLSNGTDALNLALRACGIGHGDEVITVANTFIATAEAISLVGATPVFIDIDPDSYTLDWRQLESALSPRTRAIIPVHLYGHPAEMEPIIAFARAHELRVIEDASQAQGACCGGQPVGSFGDIACFSLYLSKNLGAYGEAGICVTNNEKLDETLRLLRDHGSVIRYQHDIIGTNARMDEIQAAILRVKLPYLDQWNEARRAHARAYDAQLSGLVERIPMVKAWAEPVYYVYVVQVEDRDHFREILQREGIATGIHYPIPIHLQPACAHYGYKVGSLPITEAMTRRIVSLPMYPELTEEQIERVAHAVRLACELAPVK